MPLPDGTLTDDEFGLVVTKLFEFWNANGGKKPCPSCGEEQFFIHPALLANRSDAVSQDGKHTRLPTVGVYCQRCGYLTHYVARLLGIEPRSVEELNGQ